MATVRLAHGNHQAEWTPYTFGLAGQCLVSEVISLKGGLVNLKRLKLAIMLPDGTIAFKKTLQR